MTAGAGAMPPGMDEKVFAEPWQAEAFALAVVLEGRGLFTWSEWAAALGRAIAAAPPAAGPDDGGHYYACWLAALESLLVAKGVTSAADIMRLQTDWLAAAAATPHGEPVALAQEVRARLDRRG